MIDTHPAFAHFALDSLPLRGWTCQQQFLPSCRKNQVTEQEGAASIRWWIRVCPGLVSFRPEAEGRSRGIWPHRGARHVRSQMSRLRFAALDMTGGGHAVSFDRRRPCHRMPTAPEQDRSSHRFTSHRENYTLDVRLYALRV